MVKEQKTLFDFFTKKNKVIVPDINSISNNTSDTINNNNTITTTDTSSYLFSTINEGNLESALSSTPRGVTTSPVNSSSLKRDDIIEVNNTNNLIYTSNNFIPTSNSITLDSSGYKKIRNKTIANTNVRVKRSRSKLQTSLDFGQRDAGGLITCYQCEMIYNPADDEDARLHRRRCHHPLAELAAAAAPQKKNKNNNIKSDQNKYNINSEREASDWLGSALAVRALAGVARLEATPPVSREFSIYIYDSSSNNISNNTSNSSESSSLLQLVAALQCPELLLLPAAGFILVAIVHSRSHLLLCTVAGRPSTRAQDPALQLLTEKRGCRTQHHVTFCDVAHIWLQREGALTGVEESNGEVMQNFFHCSNVNRQKQQQRQLLLENALRQALKTLGRNITYGYTLCPRTQFSYDNSILSDKILRFVEAVTATDDSTPLYTHDDNNDGNNSYNNSNRGSDDELSVVSYGE